MLLAKLNFNAVHFWAFMLPFLFHSGSEAPIPIRDRVKSSLHWTFIRSNSANGARIAHP